MRQPKMLLTFAALTSIVLAGVVGGAAHADAGPTAQTSGGRTTDAPNIPPRAIGGPFVTFMFSRTEVGEAMQCVPNNTGAAPLETLIAPYLASLDMTATGTLVTSKIHETDRRCTHWGSSMMGSWADAAMLSTNYGWSFVSHTATYPADLTSLTAQQSYDETCGSADAIDAHGLHGGHGMIAYPGVDGSPVALQTDFGSACFAWGRTYDPGATTFSSAASSAPFWQVTAAPKGGPCNDPTQPCYNVDALGSHRYALPSVQIAHIDALLPGEWMTLQSFVLVIGTSPPGSKIQWDCTSADPNEHWTSDNERYCYNDWKSVVNAVSQRPDIKVADPLTVGIAFGRPRLYAH
jgi:hypothetical protein